jgi:hypothetical protein
MNTENIIPEIHRHRENLARACGLDVKKLVAHYQRRESGRKDAGHRLVSFVGSPVETEATGFLRDAPHKKGK